MPQALLAAGRIDRLVLGRKGRDPVFQNLKTGRIDVVGAQRWHLFAIEHGVTASFSHSEVNTTVSHVLP